MSGHHCSMPCCAGASCSTGACDISSGAAAEPKALIEKEEAESHCAAGHHQEQHGAVEVIEVAPLQDDSSVHGDSSEQHHASHLNEHSATTLLDDAELRRASVSAAAVTQACASDCCAGASSFSQTRRGREQAIPAQANGFRPPASQPYSYGASLPLSFNSRRHRHTPPRAPPSLFSE